MDQEFLSPAARVAAGRLAADLQRAFGDRLQVVIAYPMAAGAAPRGAPVTCTLAILNAVSFSDFAALLTVVPAWHKSGLATPLILGREEFERSLDVFPIEYGGILARRVVLYGSWPFDQARISETDLRRACERQIKGHLIHLREGYLETHGRPSAIAELIRASVPAFRSALESIARLHGVSATDDQGALSDAGIDATTVRKVLGFDKAGTGTDAPDLMPAYVDVVERLWKLVDGWSAGR
jgi:hypothetical protein